MVKSGVIAVVNYKGNILLGKKRSDSYKPFAGKWHIPGETVKNGESDEQALIRGIIEEASINIKVGKYIGSTITPSSKKQARWYECFSDTDIVKAGSDLEDIKWVPRNKVLNKIDVKVIDLLNYNIQSYFS